MPPEQQPDPHQSPSVLVEAARGGDCGARDVLFRLSERFLRRYISLQAGPKLRRFLSLSDMCQDTYLRALMGLERLREGATPEDFRALLLTQARWAVQDRARQVKRLAGESSAPEGLSAAADSKPRTGVVTRADELEQLRKHLLQLPEPYADVLRLRAEGMTRAAIAERLGISHEAVKKRLLRGSVKLRELVAKNARS